MNKKVAYMGMYIALALIFSYVELLIPFHIGIPGIKLGLANVVVVVVLYKIGWKEAYVVSIVRVILVGILFGNLASISFSLSGCLLSLSIMCLIYNHNMLSIIGVSIVGAICHNLGQICIAMLVVSSFHVMYYFPVLMIAGMVTGILIGIISKEMIARIR